MTDFESYTTEVIQQLVEQQKKELNDSLLYASYIQKALLPTESMLRRQFPDQFLLYIPRDVVSGDFYWISRKRNLIYFALADCTGHGVPGAFLSILGITFLNQVVDRNENGKASSVLNSLREFIMKALHQTGDISEQKDGIDMALCIVDTENHSLQYAGAFNPIYVIKNNKKLIEIPADKMPIGVAAEEELSFTNHSIELEEGNLIYLFSDGFADQFGGPDGKKYKYKPFRKLLQRIAHLEMGKQKEELHKEYIKWRGNQTQLDDISVFGFRYTKK